MAGHLCAEIGNFEGKYLQGFKRKETQRRRRCITQAMGGRRKEIAALQDQEKTIPASRYYLICERHGLNKEKADFLSDYFHDLGVFLHFRDDILLRNTIYINHEWVTKAIYNVFDYKKGKR